MGNFRDLATWQLARELSVTVYRATRQFPHDEKFGLTSQLRRAAVSVAANIAEGSGRGSDREWQRFLRIARGSLQEVICHVVIAEDLGYLKSASAHEIINQADRLAGALVGLLRYAARELAASNEPADRE